MMEEKHAVGLAEGVDNGIFDFDILIECFQNPEYANLVEDIVKIWSRYNDLTRGVLYRVLQHQINKQFLEGCFNVK